MDFSYTDDQVALRDAVQRYCDDQYPATERGDAATPAQLATRWQGLAELGLTGLLVAPEHGGSGLGPVEAMLVAQTLGQALDASAWLPHSVMACGLMQRLGSPAQQAQWLPAWAQGEATTVLAWHETAARHDRTRVQTRARQDGKDWVLDGQKALVWQAEQARWLLVLARSAGADDAPEGLALFLVASDAPGVTLQGHDLLDNRRAATVRLAGVRVPEGQRLAAGDVATALDEVLDTATAMLVAEASGAVQALLSLCAEHLRTRRQFGAPLAKFQALQHRVADLAMDAEQLLSMACAAAMAVQDAAPLQRQRVVSAAKVLAGQMGQRAGLEAIQLFGAMGMTDECRVGHYAKRLLVIGQSLGDRQWHLQRLTRLPAASLSH